MKTKTLTAFFVALFVCPSFAADSTIPASGIVNISSIVYVDGISPVVVGFRVNSTGDRFLIRAIGPELEQFGVVNFLADPVISVTDGHDEPHTNDDWGGIGDVSLSFVTKMRLTEDSVGAFHATLGSKSAVLVGGLQRGNHTVLVTAGTKNPNLNPAGIALVEIYFLPPEPETPNPFW